MIEQENFDLKTALKSLPKAPGVYLMKDETGQIIYIGKAKILKNRVRSYFYASKNKEPKIDALVKKIRSFEYIVTDNETSAIILENNLIKAHMPRYNAALKDDRTYPYILLTDYEDFPRFLYAHRRNRFLYANGKEAQKKGQGKFFGPYPFGDAAREILRLIHDIWQLRRCKKLAKNSRPCLWHYTGRCKAPCAKLISKEEYALIIKECSDFISGKTEQAQERLKNQMMAFSDALEFEKAAEARDALRVLQNLNPNQLAERASDDDADIIAIATEEKEGFAVAQVFSMRAGKIVGREQFSMEGAEFSSETYSAFIKRFYAEAVFIPRSIVLYEESGDEEALCAWLSSLRGRKTELFVPQRGSWRKLALFAHKNARWALLKTRQSIKSESKTRSEELETLRAILKLPTLPQRIEAYDISGMQGINSVAAMIVFEDGAKKPSDYRKFRLNSSSDDYAGMEEVISRRFKRYLNAQKQKQKIFLDFSVLPDLIMLDGGRGQVNIVKQTLRILKISVPVCGMVKDDKHRFRALLYEGEEYEDLDKAGKLVIRIQDEVHRFAIEYHRKARGILMLKSVLDDIPGIGPKRKQALLSKFGGIELLKSASLEEIKSTENMNERAARAVHDFFNNN